ncbi:tetratricopeptide repeat-containing sulfotransferase family protein [Novosphingobium acidiphilum]|uniref:tetratricopeptide repeat-containing sulfotransferase family protein n=1 Tax=Novosphingobium acidiphilum TaxID=505248 RepID=UPI00048E3872|nr:sulfotransferase [Novosphingobium acidiphilum]
MADPHAAQERTVSLDAALAHAAAMLGRDPRLALAQTREILNAVPGHPQAILIEGQALHTLGDLPAARAVLTRLSAEQPRSALTAFELAMVHGGLGEHDLAVIALERAVALKPDLLAAWHALPVALRAAGRERDARRAELRGVAASARDPILVKAAMAMHAKDFAAAEALLDERMRLMPRDAAAMRLRGEVAWRQGQMSEAVELLKRTLDIAPGFGAARELLVRIVQMGHDVAGALDHATILLDDEPDNPGHALLKASLQVRLGEQDAAAAIYRDLIARGLGNPRVWLNLGHVEKTLGNQADCIAAYRHALDHDPALGEAWWSLANLKTVKLGPDDIAAMTAVQDTVEDDEQASQLHFALGKAYEDAGDVGESFAHYARGNALRRKGVDYDEARILNGAQEHAALFAAPFLASRAGQGCPDHDPIFIVGLPRAGSTLVEQILSSHSQIEGTMELPDLMMIGDRLHSRVEDGEFASFADVVRSLAPADLTRLGQEYLDRTRVHRKEGKPRFIDKMPNNWMYAGLIRLILPNATIIDARRHPMGCCFSGWKQFFARGQLFSYDLAEIGRYYRAYVAQMAAFDREAPGAVHRVIYEDMVADTEGQVRRLLDHVGVPFEEECLAFYRNRRAVRTASSEQVRQPIFTDGVDHWRQFEPHLGPLRDALGAVEAAYPLVPADLV